MSSTPPTRPAKGPTPSYSTTIPPASEAYWPDNFGDRIWRYLYSFLDKNDADNAVADYKAGKKYPYPAGYSNVQTAGVASGGAQGGNPALFDVAYEVSVKVTNTGSRPGKAVAQLYVQYPTGIAFDTPVIQLRDFEKTKALAAGESQVVTLRVTRKDLSVWDATKQNWVVPNVGGDYGVWVGESSDALRLRCGTASKSCAGGQTSPV